MLLSWGEWTKRLGRSKNLLQKWCWTSVQIVNSAAWMIWISSRWPSAALFSFLPLSMWSHRLGLPRPGCALQAWAAGNGKLPAPPAAPMTVWGDTGYLWGLIFKHFKILWWFLSSLGNDDLAVWGWLLISPFVFGWVVQHSWQQILLGRLGRLFQFSWFKCWYLFGYLIWENSFVNHREDQKNSMWD